MGAGLLTITKKHNIAVVFFRFHNVYNIRI